MPSPSSASCATPRASGRARPSCWLPGRRSWSARCSAGSAPMACGGSAPPTARCPARTASAPSPPASPSTCWSPTASRVPRSTPPPPPATRPASCSTRPSAWWARSPALRRRVQVLINNLNVEASASRFMPLSSDASTMDGLNVHGAIIDELHAHRTRHVVDVLETATGARRQPLLFEITTAGYDRHSICFEHHDYAIKLLEGTLQDDSWFAFIASADEDDDWTDPKVWRKANPSFGLSVKEDDLARKAEKAIALPGAQNAFRRMHLNEWTEQAERWIDLAAWDACDGPVHLEHAARPALLRRPRSLGHHRRHRTRLGVPARAGRWPLACAVALLRARGEPPQACRARPRALRPVDPAGLHRGDAGQRGRLRRDRAAHPGR